MELFEWQGHTVRWQRQGAGAPVVFCHGTPWSSAVWAPYAGALASNFTTYVWDMPGYGHSSKSDQVGLDVQGEVFAALLEHWDLEAPHVVAHDYGGAVALRAHLLHQRHYASLALVDAVALRPWGSPFFRLVKDHVEVFMQVPAAMHRASVEAYIAGASYRGLRPADLDSLVEPWLGEEGQTAFYRQIAQADEAFTDDFASLLDRIEVPTRVIWGVEDTWIPVDRAHQLAEAIPDATLSLVPDAGHLIQYDAPAALAAILQRWLADAR